MSDKLLDKRNVFAHQTLTNFFHIDEFFIAHIIPQRVRVFERFDYSMICKSGPIEISQAIRREIKPIQDI